jgi:hypothetical protein
LPFGSDAAAASSAGSIPVSPTTNGASGDIFCTRAASLEGCFANASARSRAAVCVGASAAGAMRAMKPSTCVPRPRATPGAPLASSASTS